MTTDHNPRRKILKTFGAAALGAGALTASASASHDEGKCTDTKKKDDKDKEKAKHEKERCHDYEGRICTLRCDQEPPAPSDDCKSNRWSAITLKSCSPCARHIRLRVGGTIVDEHRRDHGSDLSVHLVPDEKITLWYTGTLHGLETEGMDVNIAISQRAIQHAKSSKCKRESGY